MTTGRLMELPANAVGLLPAEFFSGDANAEVDDLTVEFGREVFLDNFNTVVDEAMVRHPGKQVESDAWLGPRLHAALRLTRREAAHKGVWTYLAVCEAPRYVRWRWGDASSGRTPVERFAGLESKQAFARLWWMAELFRNGSDYSSAQAAFGSQDVINNFFRMGVAHHRPTALAFAKVLRDDAERRRGVIDGDLANALAKAVNAAAATLLLDARAIDDSGDPDAFRSWISEGSDWDSGTALDDLPVGPDEPGVSEETLRRVEQVVLELAASAPRRVRAVRAQDGDDEPSFEA